MAGAIDSYISFKNPQYRLFTFGRNIAGSGDAMQTVAVGWELYARTNDPMTLGLLGLAQAAPILLFALIAGHAADHLPRKQVAVAGQLAYAASSLVLAALSAAHAGIGLYYLCIFVGITARTFGNPARTALLPQIVPLDRLANAISWDTSIRRIAVMAGSALGGWLLDWSGKPTFVRIASHVSLYVTSGHGRHAAGYPALIYLTSALLGAVSAMLLFGLRVGRTAPERRSSMSWAELAAGIHFIRGSSIILPTITLDLFAVLFGGATSLLPIYQRDILHVGAQALGWLRAAPSAGALLMAVSMAHLPQLRYPGRSMLWAVLGFGAATIIFGASRSITLSLASLFVIGCLDMVSVVVRQTLLQTQTPDDMRGRVNAINSVFISSSNEIGGFESGLVARLTSPVFSVVSGGVASMLITLFAATRWTALRNYDTRAVREADTAAEPA